MSVEIVLHGDWGSGQDHSYFACRVAAHSAVTHDGGSKRRVDVINCNDRDGRNDQVVIASDSETAMVKTPKRSTDDERSLAETERIREATLKRILNTPPKRHDAMIAERKAAREQSKG